ncbi:MAG: hypothetical protein OJF49_004222 [Ktedonobacterales bacterium]|nr:MAG: hypothetical protein OJF49_004222 [Ktedonobacterales bacterium]
MHAAHQDDARIRVAVIVPAAPPGGKATRTSALAQAALARTCSISAQHLRMGSVCALALGTRP